MSVEKILKDWKLQVYKPVYWLEGDEEYFIDRVVDFAEHHILAPEEASFNLSVFYGRDASWADVVNACMRHPMSSERQVVILKEAQHMKDIAKLEGYIENPLKSTVFIVAYKEKKVDGRSKLARTLKEKGEVLTTKKLYDNQLPEWTTELVRSKGYGIQPRALMLMVDHIGSDLSRINNEVDKLLVNIGSGKTITEDDVERYVGVSREYNPFALSSALAAKDFYKAIKIIGYFESNPKAGPIQLVLPSLYTLFSRTYVLLSLKGKDEKTLAAGIGVPPFQVREYVLAAKNYGYDGVEAALLLLHQYNLKSVGVGDTGTTGADLMKELVAKLMN